MAEEIPSEGIGGVVMNEGPDFWVDVQKVPVPQIGPNDLLVRLNCTGLCMSDCHNMMGDWGFASMASFGTKCTGHEGAGVVVKIGSEVKGWKLGERVGIKPLLDVCYNCEACWNGMENYCANGLYTGHQTDGSYKQYIASPARYTTRIPDGVPDEVAGPIMCAASTMHRALIGSGLKPSQWVVFPGGGGGVGIQGVQLAKAMGMRPIVIDGGEEKKKLATSCGAEVFIDFTKTKDVVGDVIKAADGIGAHGVLVTAYQAYPDAMKYLGSRVSGKIMVIALPPKGEVFVGGEPSSFVFKNVSITGTLIGTMQDTAACLEYARRGLLKQICEVRPLSRWNESCQQLKRGEVTGRIVIDFNKP